MQDDNFAINRPEALAQAIGGIFTVLTLAGWVIGGFSILIGGFGIANIMFVSVKERTNIIGIQKSLGAKNYFILFQFLFEAVLLSLVGGLAGILLVYLLSFMDLGSLDLQLTTGNIILGLRRFQRYRHTVRHYSSLLCLPLRPRYCHSGKVNYVPRSTALKPALQTSNKPFSPLSSTTSSFSDLSRQLTLWVF